MTDRGVPPDLDGFTYLELIGQGGFADVFLYEQVRPSRRVAIKVLLGSAVDGPSQEQFAAEANVMAQLSGHPSIVPIYEAGESQDGRPYLVMEYCPPPSLAGRFRAERFEVPEALETMIKVASAVETAHRAGILHRDIKPHNILTSSYGAPMLTDFGIAGNTSGDEAELAGLSVPWSPPEVFGEIVPVDPRSDVWSLAATLYSLLAGRSPFEILGAANDNATLMSRIERQPLSRITRADIPEVLHAVLERGMSKDISLRHPTAMAFARSLQDVQAQLNLAQTRIDVLDASPTSAPTQDSENRTQVRPVHIIVPEADAGTRLKPVVVPQVSSDPVGEAADHTMLRSKAVKSEPLPDTMAKAAPVAADQTDGSHFLRETGSSEAPVPQRGKKSKLPVAVLGSLTGLAVLIVGLALLLSDRGEDSSQTTQVIATTAAPDVDGVLGASALPPNLSHEAHPDGITFSWTLEDGVEADGFFVRSGPDLSSLSAAETTTKRSLLVEAEPAEMACIEVASIVGGTRSEPVRTCEVNR